MSHFTAATWNVFHGTPLNELERVLRRMAQRGVSLLLIQEGLRYETGLADLLWKYGFDSYQGGRESIVAFAVDDWDCISYETVQLAQSTYWRKNGSKVPLLRSPLLKLRHRDSGLVLDVLSYHTPSAIQRGGDPKGPANRLQVARESFTTMRELARGKGARLFGGDDNFDEGLGSWRVLTRKYTGLRLVRAPRPTHGKRRIDDFRVKGLKVGRGYVMQGGGDHKAHVRRFDFK